jgi:predicted Fe-S protein YdhL (DUF1289 family)
MSSGAFMHAHTEHNAAFFAKISMSAVSSSVQSPCVGVCRIDAASGLCDGCQRTLDEIAVWSSVHDRDRVAIWTRIAQRRRAALDARDAPAVPFMPPRPPLPTASD